MENISGDYSLNDDHYARHKNVIGVGNGMVLPHDRPNMFLKITLALWCIVALVGMLITFKSFKAWKEKNDKGLKPLEPGDPGMASFKIFTRDDK